MRRFTPLSVLVLMLAACSQGGLPSNAVATYAGRPELQDPDSQAILSRYADDPGLTAALQEAYGERPAGVFVPGVPAITGQSLATDRLAYIKGVAWGSVAYYDGQYAHYAGSGGPYPGLDWSRDGCSAPDGLGLGYREDFRPACNEHDFGYRNLKVFERTEANRQTTDDAFYSNMKSICAAKTWYKRPPCYAAAYAYDEAVRIGGEGSFQPTAAAVE